MRYLFLLICLFCIGFSAFSQTETEYLDQNFVKLAGKEGAVYGRNTEYEGKDKNSKVVLTNYVTGEKVSAFRSAKTERGNFLYEGPFQKWHKNGQLFYSTQYQRGRKEGESLGYYASGKLKRRETFLQDKLVKGECFNEDGTAIEYFPHEIRAEFPGGSKLMSTFIKQNLKYPPDALRSGKQGTVVVQLEIDAAGKIGNSEIVKNVYPALDAEARRIVKLLPDFTPAQEEGVAKPFLYTLPIFFQMM